MVSGDEYVDGWTVFSTGESSGFPVSLLESPFFGLVPSEGRRFLDLTGIVDSINGPFGGVRQDIELVVGQLYMLTFDVGVCNGFACANETYVGPAVSVLAKVGSTSLTATNSNAAAGNQWEKFVLYFTATTPTTQLSFEGSSNTEANRWYIGLDNIDLVAAPEPGSMVLFGFGAAGLLAFARQRASGR